MEKPIAIAPLDRALSMLTGPGVGSLVARRALGVVVIAPSILCVLFVLGENADFFAVGTGAAIMTALIILILGLVIWRTALDLNRMDDERRRVEESSLRARAEAEAASRAKSLFLTQMSDELCTPLNSIIGFSELLADETFGELNARQQRYVNQVVGNGRQLLNLLNNVLDLSKMEAGESRLERIHLEVETLVGGVERMFRGLAGNKRIALSTTVACRIPPLFADPARVHQILSNLLGNAIKFTPEGGSVAVRATVWEASAPPDGEFGFIPPRIASRLGTGRYLLVSVVDNGIGVTTSAQARLFREFGKADIPGTRPQEGVALGLALARRLVEAHGGTIWVESEGEPGKGSAFRFVIPFRKEAVPEGIPPNRRDLPLVLVIEDDRQTNTLLGQHLSGVGYAVAHAFNGAQGVQMAVDYEPRAITLDLLLPDQSGWDVLAKLKTDPRTRNIPVVVTSTRENRELGFSLGAVEYFVKPVDREQFIEAVGKVAVRQSKVFTTILVVDDEPNVVEMLTSTIEEAGFEVIAASGGREAVQKARTHLPDLIALDLVMPEVNGFEVVRQLRADPLTRDIPILVHTSRDLTETEKRELESRVQAVTQKGGVGHFMEELDRLTHRPAIRLDKELV